MIKFTPIILCGGVGNRLWPLSRPSFPKQFLSFTDDGETLIQKTYNRLNFLQKTFIQNSPILIGSEDHRFIIKNQIRNFDHKSSIILEPSPKNTAPSLTLASFEVLKNNDDAVMVVVPADHLIDVSKNFCNIFERAIKLADKDNIVLIGIEPKEPSVDYGYIEYDNTSNKIFSKIIDFKEKPSLTTAKSYLKKGNYLWNSGIFILKASKWLNLFSIAEMDNFKLIEESYKNKIIDGSFIRPNKSAFNRINSNSIDYSVMEKFKKFNTNFLIGKGRFDWNDLGSWTNIEQHYLKDHISDNEDDNLISIFSNNNFINSRDKLVVTLGINNTMIVENDNSLLVADKKKLNSIKDIKNFLTEKNKDIYHSSSISYRPWGFYKTIEEGMGFKVKRIHVFPNSSLSLQSHKYRAEHWIVISGVANIIKGDSSFILKKNESTFIPFKTKHRLMNNSKNKPLEIIEIQTGSYLEEDDIKRYEDIYGR